MRFFDREQEFEKLREIEELSHEVAQFTIITGRRRIGKTEMAKKFYENKPMLYFFVARKAEANLCRQSGQSYGCGGKPGSIYISL